MREKPVLTLVYGDTNSTLAGAIAASKLHIKLGHVEAGLRFFDRGMPEEINRILTDHCSDLLFCPTKTSVNNLNKEGITGGVHLTGDIMVDILLRHKEIAEKSDVLQSLGLKSKKYLVVTIHRASNTDNEGSLRSIVDALCQIDQTIVFPVHPRTVGFLKRYGLYDKLKENSQIKLIEPIGYLEFLKLMNHAQKIVTDSGGIQKEAYILKVPCITLLESTGWVETVEDGWNVLVGTDKAKIASVVQKFEPKGKQREMLGKGNASRNIRNVIDGVLKS
jgi:UDP-N-acetylglucosamine 2-epimerase